MLFADCSNPTDVVFLVESSSRIGKEKFEKMISFISSIATTINIDTCPFRFSVIKYGSSSIVQFDLDSPYDRAELIGKVEAVGYSHG